MSFSKRAAFILYTITTMENDTNKQLLLNEEVKQTLEEAQQTPEDAQQTLEDAKQNCTDDISNILLLGCEEKLLSKEDVEKLV
jgi:F0F1-type ATP synthase membrane subunit b/b'